MQQSLRPPITAALAAVVFGAALFSSVPAYAQDDGQAPDAGAAAPVAGPAVARVSHVGGDVTLKHGDSGADTKAVLNAPVEAGDYITTGGSGSRAEVQID